MPTLKTLPVKAAMPTYKSMDLKLPTEDCIPETDMLRYSYLIYGKGGIGKTSLTLQFPDSIHMMFEPGAKSKAFRKLEPTSWKEVEAYTSLLERDDTYKSVICDTVDLMWDMCVDDICKSKGVEFLKDIGFGDGWNIASKRFRDVLIRLHNVKGLVLLSHDKDKIDYDNKDALRYVVPSAAKRCGETIVKWCDVVGHYHINSSGEHTLRIRTNVDAEAKCRPDEFFNYTDGTPIMNINMGNTPVQAFHNFHLAFNNSIERKPEPTTKPVTMKKLVLKK